MEMEQAFQFFLLEEWSYGYSAKGTGVFCCPPKDNPVRVGFEWLWLLCCMFEPF